MNWMSIALLGLVGGAIPEVMRIIAALRSDEGITARHYVASVLNALLGLGVLLLANTDASPLQVAVQGAAFPSLFSGLVAAATKPDDSRGSDDVGVLDYLAWRR